MRNPFCLVVLLLCALSLSACQSEPTLKPEEIGDVERGRELFETSGEILVTECAHCHSLDGSIFREISPAPSLQGIAQRAGQRVEGLGVVEYIRQSITDQTFYVVDGFKDSMGTYKYKLSEEDVNNLIAFLLTQQE